MRVATWARNSRRNPSHDGRRPRNSATGGQTAPSERFAQRERLPALMAVIEVAGIARRDPDRLPGADFDAGADAPIAVGGVRQFDEEMVDIPGRQPELVVQKPFQESFQSQLVDDVVKRVGRQRHLSVGPGDHDAEFVDVDVATERRQRHVQGAEIQLRGFAAGPRDFAEPTAGRRQEGQIDDIRCRRVLAWDEGLAVRTLGALDRLRELLVLHRGERDAVERRAADVRRAADILIEVDSQCVEPLGDGRIDVVGPVVGWAAQGVLPLPPALRRHIDAAKPGAAGRNIEMQVAVRAFLAVAEALDIGVAPRVGAGQTDSVAAEPLIVFGHRQQALVLLALKLDARQLPAIREDAPAHAVERQASGAHLQPDLVALGSRYIFDRTHVDHPAAPYRSIRVYDMDRRLGSADFMTKCSLAGGKSLAVSWEALAPSGHSAFPAVASYHSMVPGGLLVTS